MTMLLRHLRLCPQVLEKLREEQSQVMHTSLAVKRHACVMTLAVTRLLVLYGQQGSVVITSSLVMWNDSDIVTRIRSDSCWSYTA